MKRQKTEQEQEPNRKQARTTKDCSLQRLESFPCLEFSYDLTMPPIRPKFSNSMFHSFPWYVIEKGSKKSEIERYEISLATIESALFTLYEGQDYFNKLEYFINYYESFWSDGSTNFIIVKKEDNRPLKSVKERGVIYTFRNLSNEYKRKGVIAISTGSFASILCYYGSIFKIPVTVVMPTFIAKKYVEKCYEYANSQATVLVQGKDVTEAHNVALRLAKERGLFYLDGNDHPNMIIGQATLGLEIAYETSCDVVILPTLIEECGLTTGIAMAIKGINPNIQIFEVQPIYTDYLVENIREETMWYYELNIPYTKYHWDQFSTTTIFDKRYKFDNKLISIMANTLKKDEFISDYYTTIGLTALKSNLRNELKGKRIVIPVFGEMDSSDNYEKFISVPMNSRAGPSTLHE